MLKSSRKKLIAIGCSYTEHYTTSSISPNVDHNFPRWPQVLADKLNMECINLGKCGIGNDYILATLIDTLLTEKNIGLVVLMWSDWHRMDFQHVEFANKLLMHRSDYRWLRFHPHRNNNEAEMFPVDLNCRTSMLQYNNSYNVTMKSLRQFLLAQMLLKDIPYLMIQGTQSIPVVKTKKISRADEFAKGRQRWQKRKEQIRLAISAMLSSKIYDEINEDKFIGWPIFWGIGGHNVGDMLDKLDPQREKLRISDDDHHPNAEGHKVMAEEIYNAYKKVYK